MLKRFTYKELKDMNATKGSLAKAIGFDTTGVDYALPQNWLDYMTEKTGYPYHLILSTTFSVYNEDLLKIEGKTQTPWITSGCQEVEEAIQAVYFNEEVTYIKKMAEKGYEWFVAIYLGTCCITHCFKANTEIGEMIRTHYPEAKYYFGGRIDEVKIKEIPKIGLLVSENGKIKEM